MVVRYRLCCDVLQEDDVAALCASAQDAFGSLDIVINNAGIGYLMSPIVETELESWDAVLGVNLRGAFLMAKHGARAMIEQGRGGRIINIASQAAKSGFPYAAAYCSSKHGMVGLTRVAAIELGKHGITRQRGVPKPHNDRPGSVAERVLLRGSWTNDGRVPGGHALTNPAGPAGSD